MCHLMNWACSNQPSYENMHERTNAHEDTNTQAQGWEITYTLCHFRFPVHSQEEEEEKEKGRRRRKRMMKCQSKFWLILKTQIEGQIAFSPVGIHECVHGLIRKGPQVCLWCPQECDVPALPGWAEMSPACGILFMLYANNLKRPSLKSLHGTRYGHTQLC